MRIDAQGRRPRWAIGLFVVAAGVLMLGAVGWACTQIMGVMTITPTSGTRGTVVNTTARGMKAYPAKYKLMFNDSARVAAGSGCHTAPIILKKDVRPNTAGTWSNVTVTVPATVPAGASQICALETYPTPANTGSSHQSFTVL